MTVTGSRTVRDYKELEVWRRSMKLAREVYRVGSLMPGSERFNLTNQMQRAATSIPSNIAEGYGRGSRKEYCQFVRIARGSAAEVETQLLLATSLEMVSREDVQGALDLVAETRRMLHGLVCALER
jgi:four helix bundle protein